MDIASMSIGIHQASITNSAQLSVIKMAMDSVESNSNDMINMINKIDLEPHKGNYIDSTI